METITISRVLCDPAIIPGLIFIAISIPLLRNKIPMNQFYGFRIAKSFASAENWYAINRYGAKQLIMLSVLLIIAGIIMLYVSMPPLYRVIPIALVVIIATVRTALFARKLPG